MSDNFFTKGIYASGMVLQQGITNCIFGKAQAGAEVVLSFRGKDYKTCADKGGEWKIEYNPGEAGGPFDMKLSSAGETIDFSQVYVGEVWVNSGQSNAQLPMERLKFSYRDEFALPENACIRMITVPINYSFDGEKDDLPAGAPKKWIPASPSTLGEMSGTGYFFAKKIQKELGVPVGIINASQGGSPISAWMDRAALKDFPKFGYEKRIDKWLDNKEIEKTKLAAEKAQNEWSEKINNSDEGNNAHWENIDFSELDSSWEDFSVPGDYSGLKEAGIVWFKKEFELTALQAEKLNSEGAWLWMGTIVDADKAWINGEFCGVTYYSYPPRRYSIPAGALKAGKNTVTMRIQKNGSSPLRFFEEKPYCIFSKKDFVVPVAYRNVEIQKEEMSEGSVKIDLTGNWKLKIACRVEKGPGSCFFEWEPTALYNSMLAPCFNYAVAGALWYQGESDAGIAVEYKDLLVKMIALWREKFVYAKKDMPFVIMQLPNWADGRKDECAIGGSWPVMRESQAAAAMISGNAAYAVTIDAGEWNDLHPEKKRTGGTRAAQEALRIAYGKNYPIAPEASLCAGNDESITVTFDCDEELIAYELIEGRVDYNSKTDKVEGFKVVLENGDIVPAQAKLINSVEVEVKLPDSKVKELRYLWVDCPEAINLYSKSGLPAAPFHLSL